MSISYDLDCGDETVTLELLDDGTLISYGFDIESEMIAREMGFEPHPCFAAMDNALRHETYNKNINIVEILLVSGADVHVNDNYALRSAVRGGHVELAKLLLEYGANVHANNNLALLDAASWGYFDIVKLLLEHGADVHAVDDYALRLAARYGHADVVEILEDWIKDHG